MDDLLGLIGIKEFQEVEYLLMPLTVCCRRWFYVLPPLNLSLSFPCCCPGPVCRCIGLYAVPVLLVNYFLLLGHIFIC